MHVSLSEYICRFQCDFNILDVNECKMSNGGCDHVCTNNNGSFFCTCNAGFILDKDRLGCPGILTSNPKKAVICSH